MSNDIRVFKITADGPVSGSLPADQVQDAVTSGEYSLPEKEDVQVISPEGKLGTLPAHQTADAFQAGYTYATPDHIKQAKYGSTEQQVKTGLEGAVEGALPFGLGTAAERIIGGVKPEDIVGRREANPVVHAAGQVAGFAGSELIPGVGAANVLSKASKAISNPAAKIAVEAALFQQGDELSKMISEDPNQSVGSAIANIGLSGLLGGAIGKGSNALWKQASESKLGAFLDSVKNRIAEHSGEPAPSSVYRSDIFGKGIARPESQAKKMVDALLERGIAKMSGASDSMLDAAKIAAFHFGGPAGYLAALVGNKALKPLTESVIPGLLKRVASSTTDASAFKAATQYALDVVKGETLLNKATSGVFASGKDVLSSTFDLDKAKLGKLDEQVKHMADDASPMLQAGAHIAHYLPDHTTQISAMASNVVNYLNSKRPAPTQLGPLDKAHPPTKQAIQAYARTLQIAEQPLSILQHVRNGSVLPQDVQDLNNMYPQMHAKLVQKLTGAAMEHLSEDGHIPYATRMGLSLFAGQPLDTTLSPQGIQSIQLTFLPKESEQNSAPKGQSKSVASLSKAATQYQTPEQARSAHRAQD